jgi:hypothetical protein
VHFAQLVKQYQREPWPDAARRQSRSRIVGVVGIYDTDRPDPDRISTSYVERQNLKMRMQSRRFTRLTNAFRERLRHHKTAGPPLCRPLRPVPGLRDAKDHARDGAWSRGSRLGRRRAGRGACPSAAASAARPVAAPGDARRAGLGGRGPALVERHKSGQHFILVPRAMLPGRSWVS